MNHEIRWLNHRLRFDDCPRVMGILNVTPDSFSDGGKFYKKETAIRQAEAMVEQGADIIDVGGESTRPFSDPVPEEEEIRRVIPVIEEIAPRIPVPVSIDTMKASVARRAIDAGASIINDVSALRADPEMAPLAARTGVLVICMHMLGEPKTMQIDPTYEDVVAEVHDFLEGSVKHASESGIPRERIIIDPGIGFGKTVEHNLCLIRNLSFFKSIGAPVLIGPSRKMFIRKKIAEVLGTEPDPDHQLVACGTQAVIALSALYGADIVRVHDVAETIATLTMVSAIQSAGRSS